MSSAAYASRSIPLPSTPLVGRADELDRTRARLFDGDVRLLTLLGPGGVGKTRIALELANTADASRFSSMHLVMLATVTDAEGVGTAVLRALGIPWAHRDDEHDPVATVIADRPVLLILDNAEHVVPHLMFLARLLARCSGLRVLVTSQVMLRLSGEHVLPVDPLPTVDADPSAIAPASALFIERAQAVRADLEIDAAAVATIDAICRQLDGLPLAIELAAARVRLLSLTSLLQRLATRLPLLTGGPRDAPERHQTLRATLTWSHDLLTDAERIVFRRLAVFENGAPYAAAIAIGDTEPGPGEDVEEALASLVDHSLVRIVDRDDIGPRVRLLQTIREFALELLDASGERETVRRAHATWFATHVRNTPPETWRSGTVPLREWTTRNEPDLANFSTTLDWLMESGDIVQALLVAGGLGSFWLELGNTREAWLWCQRVLPARADAPPFDQARISRLAAISSLGDGNDAGAVAHARDALSVAESIGDLRLIANCQNLLGSLMWQAGDPENGERIQRMAIETTRRAHPDDSLGGALFAAQIADTLVDNGEFVRAEALLAEALPAIQRERADALPLFEGTLAHIRLARNDLAGAAMCLERSLSYHAAPPHRLPGTLGERSAQAAVIASRRGYPEDAARLLGVAFSLSERSGFRLRESFRGTFDRERLIAEIRPGLDDDTWNAEIARGRRLSIPEAIARMRDVIRRPPVSASRAASPGDPAMDLTPRERDVLAMLVSGKSNAGIADALYISPRTVTTHLSRLYAKLEVSSRTEAVAVANRLGIS